MAIQLSTSSGPTRDGAAVMVVVCCLRLLYLLLGIVRRQMYVVR